MGREVKKVRNDTWIIEDDGVRFFLLEGKYRAALIDSGMNSPDAKELAEGLTDKPITLMNTHADWDHISGNDAFDVVYISAAECAFYHHAGQHTGQVVCLYEGNLIELGERELEVISLPGHTPGSVAYLDKKYRTLISGDSIQSGGNIYLFGSQRDLFAYVDSLRRLKKWNGLYDEIWPSHAALPLSPSILDSVIRDGQAALDGELPWEEREVHGTNVKAARGECNILLCDL